MNRINSKLIETLFSYGLKAVSGQDAVFKALSRSDGAAPQQIIALGKAASSMVSGAWQYFNDEIPTLIITKYDHIEGAVKARDNVEWIEAGHPVPDDNSLLAGQLMLNKVQQMNPEQSLLLLISGGASALAECLAEGMTLERLQQLTEQMLAAGLSIAQINDERKRYSLLKAGGLLRAFAGSDLTLLVVSDVQGDDLAVIGSGIGDCPQAQIIAANKMARQAVADAAIAQGLVICCNEETLYDDVYVIAERIAEQLLSGPTGGYIYGGEPTIVLPANPGKGGRNQSLALALAIKIAGVQGIEILVAGTDGTDGPTDAAGAIINGHTVDDDLVQAKQALVTANAYDYLLSKRALLVTGATGTNVMDLLIALKT